MIIGIKRYIKYAGKQKIPYFTFLILAVALFVIANILYSYMHKNAFNSITTQDYDLFKQAIIFGIIALSCELFHYVFKFLTLQQVREIFFNIKMLTFGKFTKANINYFEKNHSGDFLKKLGNDTSYLKEPYFNALFYIRNIFVGIFDLIFILIFDYRLGIISILFSVLSVYITKLSNKSIASKNKEVYSSLTKLSEFLVDILSGFLVLKMFKGGDVIREKYLSENEIVKDKMIDLTKAEASLTVTGYLISMLGNCGTIVVGIIFASKNQIDYGTIMAIVALQGDLTNSLKNLQYIYMDFIGGLTTSSKIFDFIEEDFTEDYSTKNKCELKIREGIKFKDLSFAYDKEHKILNNFNLDIKENEKIIIRGESGCGKSTILKLLLKFYEAYDGKIEIFGNDLKDYSLEQLRELITYIPQESFLFDATIKENIRYAREEATEADILKAIEKAHCDDFILNKENGLDEHVKAGGTNFSGGERQRLSIARAFLKNSPIIIMDEPTSSLDTNSEGKIDLAIENLMQDKIIIMVTHKMKEYNNFDRTIEMKTNE